MKLTFLGTGTSQGVPVIGCACPVCTSLDFRDKRLRSSVHIEIQGQSFVIDTGPDFRQQMLRERIAKVDAVIFTHAHRDHTAGLDDIRAYNYIQQMEMPVFGTAQTLDQLKGEYAYAFTEEKIPGLPLLNMNTIGDAPFTLNGIHIEPLPVQHAMMPVLGFRFENLSYITDAKTIPPVTLERLAGTEILILNALQQDPHVSHLNLNEALEVVRKVRPKQTYFTHISHRMGLHHTIQKQLPPGVFLGYDGLQIHST